MFKTNSTTTRRWTLINRKTAKAGRSYVTRTAAREAKSPNQRIFDNLRATFVR